MILMLTILPVFPIAIYFLYKLYKKQGEVLEKERKVYLDLSKNIEQNTSGFSLIKLYNEQENQRKKFNKVNEETYISDVNVGAIIYKMDMVANILYATCYSIGFVVGLLLINKGLLTIGELTAYISCITIAISEIVNSIEPLLTGISNFKIASKRFNYFFGLDTYKKEGKKLEKVDKIEIKNLCYSYENDRKLEIKNINMTINSGDKIGIVGKVGSGKTTLMNILAGFYEVPENKIFINGIDMNEYSRESIFENIGYAMQKNIIMDDTIKNNIDIENEATNNEIEDISKKANILEDITTMQDGFETKIGENKVLHNISFIIKEGNKVTIAGKTGVGKTTLANILMRLYPIQSGKILIGGRNIQEIRIQDIRKNISYISQTPYILNDTLKNNIILGDKTITDEQIRIVANEIGFEKVLDKFTDGLEEKIEKNKLSYGQLQMIAFLRAILHKANIYIFDEPTSNIDLKTEDRIQKLIDKITKESTVIIIAHRKSTIENSDKIIYLRDGKVDMIINKEKVID